MSENTIGGIITAVITGLFTLLITIHKERKEDLKEKQREHEKRYENRPEFAVVDYKDYLSRVGYGIKQKCDIELFVADMEEVDNTVRIREEDINSNNWCCVIYTLKNVGNTDTVALSINMSVRKNICIFPCANIKELFNLGIRSYLEFYDKKICVGDTVSIKLCYHKDRVMEGVFSAIMIIALEDCYRHYWHQAFFSPENKLYGSHEVDAEEYFLRFRNNS